MDQRELTEGPAVAWVPVCSPMERPFCWEGPIGYVRHDEADGKCPVILRTNEKEEKTQ